MPKLGPWATQVTAPDPHRVTVSTWGAGSESNVEAVYDTQGLGQLLAPTPRIQIVLVELLGKDTRCVVGEVVKINVGCVLGSGGERGPS